MIFTIDNKKNQYIIVLFLSERKSLIIQFLQKTDGVKHLKQFLNSQDDNLIYEGMQTLGEMASTDGSNKMQKNPEVLKLLHNLGFVPILENILQIYDIPLKQGPNQDFVEFCELKETREQSKQYAQYLRAQILKQQL